MKDCSSCSIIIKLLLSPCDALVTGDIAVIKTDKNPIGLGLCASGG